MELGGCLGRNAILGVDQYQLLGSIIGVGPSGSVTTLGETFSAEDTLDEE